jgi:cytidine deaminase
MALEREKEPVRLRVALNGEYKREPTVEILRETPFQILNLEDLNEQERLAVEDAIQAYKGSTNKEFRAGACAVAENGEKVSRHNLSTEPGTGQTGHAEMLALDALYSSDDPAARHLKIIALAATYPDQELVRSDEKYNGNSIIEDINQIDVHRVCGRCLKMLSDYTGNNVPDMNEKGEKIPGWDPIILMVIGTGQVLRTRLSVLYSMPHIPHQMAIRPWEKEEKKDATTPDTYSTDAPPK